MVKTANARGTERSLGLTLVNSPGAEGLDCARHAAQFRQPLEPPDAGVARVDLLANVVQQQMTVVRPHRDLRVRPPLGCPPLLLAHDHGGHADQVGVAVKMRRLVK